MTPKVFLPIDDYTTFRAEYEFSEGGVYTFHFFTTPEVEQLAGPSKRVYWQEAFPRALSEVAQSFFRAEYPQVRAAYTEEVRSWWFEARGFAHVLNAEVFARRFLELLDQALDATIQTKR